MRRASAALGLLVSSLACTQTPPREGQVLLYITTDAPLPAPPGKPPSDPPALFDRLRIEIVRPGELEPCAGCTREFGLDAETMNAGRTSIGIATPPGEGGTRVRVRIYRGGGTASGEPRVASTLETVVVLPVVQEGDRLERSVILHTEHIAVPQGSLDAALAPQEGPPPVGLVGSWWRARRVMCAEPPGPEEACVPGGAYWMGDPRLDFGAVFEHDGELERLVVLSPFYLDVAEASVPALRASGLAKSLTPGGPADDPHEAGSGIADCTFTSDPGPFEDRPVNCLTWTMARDFCASLGKTLPSEAQQEWVMSGLGAGRFVWGTDFPRCEDAVWGRTNAADACGVLGSGSTPSGVGWRDRLLLGDREVVDLNGNLIEWAADRWNRQDEPCWGVGLFLDPVCDATGSVDGVARSIRGGHWASPLTTLPAAVRARVINETQAVSAYVGVRCSRPAQPAP